MVGKCHGEKHFDMPELFSNALNNKDIGFITKPLESGAGYHHS